MKTPTLIGISGRIHSGKDTTARIIQLLETRKHYNLEIALENFFMYERFSKWEIKKFAGKLKEIGGILAGVSPADFEDQDFKNQSMGPDWGDMTYRTFLQRLGTEAIRENIHPNAWVNALMADYRPQKMSQYNPSQWLITDVRFPNEAQAVIDNGGIMIRVERGQDTPDVSTLHASETALDNWNFDHIIRNYGDLNKLEKEVKLFCDKYGLI